MSPTLKVHFSLNSSIKTESRVGFLACLARGSRKDSCFVWGMVFGCLFLSKQTQISAILGFFFLFVYFFYLGN